MKIINIATDETVAEITTNYSMTLDDAIDLVGEMVDRWDPCSPVLIGGNLYSYDDLAIEW